jgi:hypothetical protein
LGELIRCKITVFKFFISIISAPIASTAMFLGGEHASKSTPSFLVEHNGRRRAVRRPSSWTVTKGSSTPAATAPTSIDDTEIDTTVSGSGSASAFRLPGSHRRRGLRRQRPADDQRSVTGTGILTVGAQETLAINGSVGLTGQGSINFYGWYGTLAIGNAAGFSSTTPIYSFMPGDTIDLKNVPFVSSNSS